MMGFRSRGSPAINEENSIALLARGWKVEGYAFFQAIALGLKT